MQPQWVSAGADVTQPNAARVHDYYLGGRHHLAADRYWADQVLATQPETSEKLRAHRAFLVRAVRFCVEMGLRQFLELGSGLPTCGHVHEVAEQASPDCRVVYVDHDPVAVAHSRKLLAGNLRAAVVRADLSRVDDVFAAPEVRHLLDIDQPIVILLVSVLQHVSDADSPSAIIAEYHRRVAAGSYVVVAHPGPEDAPDVSVSHPPARQHAQSRTAAQLRELIGAFQPVAPGVVPLPTWRPESPDEFERRAERYQSLAVVARKPVNGPGGGKA